MKVRLILEGGKATAAPPVGPALGSKGLPAQQFCVKFNEETKHLQYVYTIIIFGFSIKYFKSFMNFAPSYPSITL